MHSEQFTLNTVPTLLAEFVEEQARQILSYQASTTLLINAARNPSSLSYTDPLTRERSAKTWAGRLPRR